MNRTVTVLVVGDRHAMAHERAFATTERVTVDADGVGDAIAQALDRLGLAGLEGACVVSVDWPHE